MIDMIEIVARIFCREAHMLQPDVIVHGTGIWREGELDAKVDAYWSKWAPAARQAIEALRTPTDAMLAVLAHTPVDCGTRSADPGDATIIWQAMIDAALNVQPGGLERGIPVYRTDGDT